MNESYKDLKAYLLNEIAEDAHGVLNAIEGKEADKVDDEEVLCVTCPACGMSNSIAWGSMDLPPFRQAVAMLADSWNSR